MQFVLVLLLLISLFPFNQHARSNYLDAIGGYAHMFGDRWCHKSLEIDGFALFWAAVGFAKFLPEYV